MIASLASLQQSLKQFDDDSGSLRKRWMRRSRYVAREFAREKRMDTFSPATGAHTSNLLPLKYLMMKAETSNLQGDYGVVLGCLDVTDAFLQVEQDEPILFTYRMRHLSVDASYLDGACGINASEGTLLTAWVLSGAQSSLALQRIQNVFLKGVGEKFAVSHSQLEGPGSSICSLKRTVKEDVAIDPRI